MPEKEITPFVTVIMPIRNEATFIEESLTAVLSQDYPPNRVEIIVADGMSDDGTREIVRSYESIHDNLRLIENRGKIVAKGLNAAILQARGDIVVRVDGHCQIAPDYVSRCVEHLQSDSIDGVGGSLQTVGITPVAKAIGAAMSSLFGVGGSAFRTSKNRTLFVDTIPFPAYKRSVMTKAGPYDEELVRDQDDEYNYRLRKMGARLLLASNVHAKYYSRSSLRSLLRQYFQYGYWKVRVLQKHPRQMHARQFVPPLFVTALMTCSLGALFSPLFKFFMVLIFGSYIAINIAASVMNAKKVGWSQLPVIQLAFATLHFGYGSGFLYGLIRLWGRWR